MPHLILGLSRYSHLTDMGFKFQVPMAALDGTAGPRQTIQGYVRVHSRRGTKGDQGSGQGHTLAAAELNSSPDSLTGPRIRVPGESA